MRVSRGVDPRVIGGAEIVIDLDPAFAATDTGTRDVEILDRGNATDRIQHEIRFEHAVANLDHEVVAGDMDSACLLVPYPPDAELLGMREDRCQEVRVELAAERIRIGLDDGHLTPEARE